MNYLMNKNFSINVGFKVAYKNVLDSTELTNSILKDLPASLYRSVDFKTTSSVVGSVFCDVLAKNTGSIVNPIEKGHPDLVPQEAQSANEETLRNYPNGLEIKCTIGGVQQGANLRAGVQRIGKLTGVTWQAHHREVEELMGLTWDFAEPKAEFNFPIITGIFYANNLSVTDWGEISGTSGRNTKVTGMATSGKAKMGAGWVLVANEPQYLSAFKKFLKCPF